MNKHTNIKTNNRLKMMLRFKMFIEPEIRGHTNCWSVTLHLICTIQRKREKKRRREKKRERTERQIKNRDIWREKKK